MQIDVPTVMGHDLLGMQDSLRAMVGKKVDQDTKNQLANLTQQIAQEVEEDVLRERTEAEDACNLWVSNGQACIDTMNDNREKEELLAQATAGSRTAHKECREVEHGFCIFKEGNVSQFRSTVREMMATMARQNRFTYADDAHRCPADSEQYADHRPGYLATNDVTDSIVRVMDGEQNFYMTYSETYAQQSQDCKDATSQWKRKAIACDEKQTAFEQDYCRWYYDSNLMCQSYRDCYDENQISYNAASKTAEEIEINLKNQWKALKLLECYSEMIRDEISDFSHCDIEIDVSHLDITCQPYPLPSPCVITADKPCDVDWKAKHYDSITMAFPKVSLATCTPC
jgi:hypothetical protein